MPSLLWGRFNMESLSVNYSGYHAWCMDHAPCTLNIYLIYFVIEAHCSSHKNQFVRPFHAIYIFQ